MRFDGPIVEASLADGLIGEDDLCTWALNSLKHFNTVGLDGLYVAQCQQACLHPQVQTLPHLASTLLNHLR